MSNPTVVHGYIKEFYPKRDKYEHLRIANDAAIENLPERDEYPSLSRSSFSSTGRDTEQGTFRGIRLIHFAGHYNHIQNTIDVWLTKFESFLATLYWSDAIVHINSGWAGPDFSLCYGITQDIAKGYFEGILGDSENFQVEAYIDNQPYPKLESLGQFVGESRLNKIKNTHSKLV